MFRSMTSTSVCSATYAAARAHDVRVLAEELERDRPAGLLVGMDAQHLGHVFSLPWWMPKLDTISDTARPAP